MESKAKNFFANAPYLLFFLLYWCAISFFEPYMSLFLSERGLDGAEIGIISCALYIVTLVAAFFMGYLADRSGRPKLVLIITLAGIMAATWGIRQAHGVFPLTVACIFYGFFNAPATDLADKLALRNIPNAMRHYSIFRMGGSVGYCVGTLLAGAVIAGFGFLVSLDILIVAMAGCILSCLGMSRARNDRGVVHGKVPLGEIFKNPKAYYIYGCMALWGVVSGGGLSYASFYVDQMGFDTNFAAWLIAAAMVGQMLMFLLVPAILRKLGEEASVSLALVLLFFRIGALALCRHLPLWAVLGLHFLGGPSEPLMLCAIVSMVNSTFSARVSSTSQALKSVASKGIGSSLGTLVLGIMFDKIAPFWVMVSVACACLVFAAIAWVWFKALNNRIAIPASRG